MRYRLFLIHENLQPAFRLTDSLREQGYLVDQASPGDLSTDLALADTFDLIVIEGSTGIKCAEICSELRSRNIRVPLLVVSEPDDLGAKIAAFEAGADDYLPQAVDILELRARVAALLRRVVPKAALPVARYSMGTVRVDFTTSQVVKQGFTVALSERECRLLQYFIENRGHTVSRNALLRQVWGYRRAPLTRTVDVHILRLRRKIELDPRNPQFIITVPGLGYRFNE